ncbi:hypothetical protein [Crenobacter intestini]|uniref:Uncharacterized protein n=1 Tax=Crenobacter intestini TaxID=2563443 RepID=A0A4V4N7H3_9NEIS|nr:hypothetical protein [Crenobacter intestini]TIC80573.1 hypothetical protein E5K04_12120 [Crenobacter intestini]
MSEQTQGRPAWDWMSPSAERLQSKITSLEVSLNEFEARQLTDEQKRVVGICKVYLGRAHDLLDRPAFGSKFPFPFLSRKHPHLVWELLHRVDEQLILLMTPEEFAGKAVEVKTAFDLNITEEKSRADWIGPKGRLIGVIDRVTNGNATPADHATAKDALQQVNEQMDRSFWQLSANTLTSVWSAAILGLLLVLAWCSHTGNALHGLAQGGLVTHSKTLLVLGLMGAYASNVLTREDFLYVRGGPFFRYFLLHLLAKPLMGAFAALFVFVLEKSKLLFAIVTADGAVGHGAASHLITINVGAADAGYVYAELAVASGFGADKLLRSTFDSVLKRLEQRAEKTKDSAGK